MDPVGPGDGLHEGVAAHWLVEIQGRATRGVETRQPHGADEDQPKIVAGIPEFRLQVLLHHPFPVRENVEAALLHFLDLVLPGGHDHCHAARREILETIFQLGIFLSADGNSFHFSLNPSVFGLPLGADLLEHPQGRELVDGDDHGLALVASLEEMVDDVLRDGIEPVVAGDEVVALPEDVSEFVFLRHVQIGRVDRLVDLFVQIRIGHLEFRGPVLVVERHGGPVIDRLLEVVDADVVAEDLPRPLLSRDQRRPGEGEEIRVRQGRPHVHGEGVVLAPVGLVRQHDDVVPLGQDRVQRPRIGAELVDQGEDVAVILAEDLAQVAAAGRLAMALGRGSAGGEGAVDLVVEFGPVGDDHEGQVARDLAEHLLGEEHHRETLPALGVTSI